MDFPDTITRLRAQTVVSPYDPESTVSDWSLTPDSREYAAFVDAQVSSEQNDAVRESSYTTATVYLPYTSADIRRGDRISYAGGTWTVEGFPVVPKNPFTGWAPYLVVSIKEVVG